MIDMKRFIAFFLILISLFIICSCDCEHQWDKGKITKVSTDTEDGTILYTCLKCGDERTEGYHSNHQYSNNWGYDSESHWLICDKQGCETATVSAKHTFNDKGKCVICKYEQ